MHYIFQISLKILMIDLKFSFKILFLKLFFFMHKLFSLIFFLCFFLTLAFHGRSFHRMTGNIGYLSEGAKKPAGNSEHRPGTF